MRARRPALLAVVALLALAGACSDGSGRAGDGTSSGGPATRGTVRLPTCPPAPAPGAGTPSAPLEEVRHAAGTLAVQDVANLDESVTALAARCTERALYATTQAGRVVRIDLAAPPDSTPATVLDITERVESGGEQGLLGLAFSPDGSQLYLAYTNRDQDQELARWSVGADGTVDPASRTRVLVVGDFAPNHNGGQLVFGPDGYLWWGMGDGGGGGDSTRHTGQDPSDLLGDILRIDVAHPSGGRQYSIPADNPFASGGGAAEVYAYGLRNPWRFSFDAATGDLWIADVGQGQWEEIDHAGPGGARGANFGWSRMEGSHPFDGGTNPPGGVLPVYEYDHSKGGCAVIGGFAYRGTGIAGLAGTYLYGDDCTGEIDGLWLGPDGRVTPVAIGLGVGGLSTFGEDVDGELYAASVGGTVVKVVGG